jgi:cephalosporin hydroxylase
LDYPNLENSLDISIGQLLPIMQERLMHKSKYHGIQTWKNPIDFWVYQEIIFDIKPDLIIEIGLHRGGSTLALAHMLDRNENGKILGIDLSLSLIDEQVRNHDRISLIEGNPLELFEKVNQYISPDSTVLIIEDSSHEYENTLAVLNMYGSLVSENSFFIVEDGICYHGLDVGPKPGPYEAVHDFIKDNENFIIDRSKEDFLLTWNPCGFLKRIN